MSPVITLKNGVRIANFSSPHPFTFITGEVLPACDSETAKTLMLSSEEEEIPNPLGITDIKLTFRMSDMIQSHLTTLEHDDSVDIVLVPFPVMEAVKSSSLQFAKIRVCRTADRVTKTIHSDKFCI